MMPRLAGLLLCAAATASDVLFVHVGKTCGGTIAAELRKNRVAYHEVHLDKVDGEKLAKYKRVIVSARDPVDRVVSAFNWRSPHACRERKGESVCGNQNFAARPAESLRRPPRHRRDACSMAWRYRLISTQVDGGIKATPETIGACAAAGANCFIAGSGLFAYNDLSAGVQELRKIAIAAQNGDVLARPSER